MCEVFKARLYKDETIWASQKAMAVLFDVGIPAINKHLVNIFADGELRKEATVSKMEIVQTEGNRDVKRMMELYNLDAIISVGYRVNSIRATQFRQWCTYVIRHFSLRGYIIDKKRMENGDSIRNSRIFMPQALTITGMRLSQKSSILNSATLWFNFIYKYLSNKKLLRILPCQIFHLS